MKFCVIDIGSNTVKTDIFSYEKNSIPTSLFRQSKRCALASCKTNGTISDIGIQRIFDTLTLYKAEAEMHKADEIFAFATASLRNVSNANEIVSDVYKKLGIKIEIISGEKEALCSFYGMIAACPDAVNGVMADMGGGSTELVPFENKKPTSFTSLPFGSLSLKEKLKIKNIPDEEDKTKIFEYVASVIPKDQKFSEIFYVVGGTAKNIFQLYEDMTGKTGNMDVADAEKFFDTLCNLPSISQILKKQFPERYDSLLPGFYAFIALAKLCKASTFKISDGGVRQGYLLINQQNI